LAIDPQDARSLSGMGMCLMMEQQPQDAYNYFVRALQSGPGHLVTLLQLIECAYYLGRFDDLERFLREYVKEHPTDMELVYCHAGSLYKLGRFAESEALTTRVLEWNPSHLGARQLKDLINEDKQKNTATPKPIDTALKSNIEVQKTPNLLSDYTERRLSELEDLKRERQFDKVIEGCREVLARPGVQREVSERATLLLAECFVLTNELAQAGQLYDQVLRQNSGSARAMCGKGALSANAGDWNKAKEFFESALRVKPGYDVALAGLGLSAHYGKDSEQAWNYYSQALQSNPENTRALLGVMELGYALGKLSEVEAAIQNYLEMHPADLDFLYALAGCYFAQGRNEEALREVSKITLFQPAHSKALELRGMIENRASATA